MRIFRDISFAAGTAVMAVSRFVMYGSQVCMSLWLQTLMGYPSIRAGLAMGLGAALAMPLAAALVAKFDLRKVFCARVLTFAFSFYQLMKFNLQIGYWDIFWPQFIQGISMGLLFVPLTVVTMAFIPKEGMGNATSLFNMLRNIGGSVGISVVSTMLTRLIQEHTNLLVGRVTPFSLLTLRMFEGMRLLFGASGPVLADKKACAALFALVQQQASMVALIRIFQYLGVLVLVLIPLIAFTRKPPKSDTPAPLAH